MQLHPCIVLMKVCEYATHRLLTHYILINVGACNEDEHELGVFHISKKYTNVNFDNVCMSTLLILFNCIIWHSHVEQTMCQNKSITNMQDIA